jgi:signal transduction histidine kinase
MAANGEHATYMANEIRNPLFSIGGFANSLLRNPSLNEFAREKAGIIYDESRRLDAILTSILNFARPTQQAIGIFDAATVARQTVDLMCIGSEERGITVNVDIAQGLPKASGNAENLKQCLINLVKNSLEAMPAGGALTLRARQEGPFVRLEVEDTGAGIAPAVQEKVFSPFYTTKHGGAGLGLAMTKKVIEEMRGKVELDSAPGRGTRISLLVPVALAVEEEGEADVPPAAL